MQRTRCKYPLFVCSAYCAGSLLLPRRPGLPNMVLVTMGSATAFRYPARRHRRGLFFNGRANIGTVSLDANELKFAADGSLTITISHAQPADVDGANWLPAPEGQFALIVRAYVPTQPVLNSRYKLPNVQRAGEGMVGRGG